MYLSTVTKKFYFVTDHHCILPCLCLTMQAAAHACFSVKNNSGLWMLMLSLNNKYFIGSVYAGMLWSLWDVTEPFHVNFFDVQKKIYIDYFYAAFADGSGTKHECRGRVQIRYISAGAVLKNPSCAGLYTEVSCFLRRPLRDMVVEKFWDGWKKFGVGGKHFFAFNKQ